MHLKVVRTPETLMATAANMLHLDHAHPVHVLFFAPNFELNVYDACIVIVCVHCLRVFVAFIVVSLCTMCTMCTMY